MDKKTEKICRMILDYLRRNPDAGDTLEGITRWWLSVERINLSVEEVAQALKGLLRKRLIRAHKPKGVTTFYKINKEL